MKIVLISRGTATMSVTTLVIQMRGSSIPNCVVMVPDTGNFSVRCASDLQHVTFADIVQSTEVQDIRPYEA